MANPDYETLHVERREGVLLVELARPEVRNAFDDRMITELTRALEEAAGDATLRALLLRGQGPVFCAGADLRWMRRAAGYGEAENRADAARMAALFQRLESLPFLTVARIEGAALGGGTGLCACCDVAISTPGARFGFTEVRLGIVPAVISPFLARRISRGAARRYFQTGEIFEGEEARRIGLVSELAEPDALDARVEAVLDHARRAGPRAAREAKVLVERVWASERDVAVAASVDLIARLRSTEEAREGMAAFLEKRPASWTGEESGP